MSSKYKTTIGLEVHAELATNSKMFCGCRNDPHHGEPNSYICPVCLAHPGTLPVPNEEAIAMVLLFGNAVGARVASFSEFDRKNYFYPDIPKAYQISQYQFPFLSGGSVKGVELTRVHLEEDTARSQHDHDGVSLVDFNRAGVPLMELVTEPVIHDAKTAGDFARELQLILQTLKISNAQMERGEMRVEANISVSTTDELGTKVEVKNLNSFKSVEGAIAYEVDRQISLLEKGDSVAQETRGWDEVKLRTFSQRSKETAKDYRYFPDPDLPKMKIDTYPYFSNARLNEIMPELPSNKRIKYENLGIPSNQIELIICTPSIGNFFEELVGLLSKSSSVGSSVGDSKVLNLAANYLTSDVLSLVQSGKTLDLSPQHFLDLVTMTSKGEINSRITKDILAEIIDKDIDPVALAKDRNLLQSSDPEALQSVVSEVLSENPSVVADYHAGKAPAIQYLVGQGMKKTRGSANPAVFAELLVKALSK
ncbi:MAG: Asp-tRNA(Asn)/Glu-tRNA(Gln) amidotransferase subunit GatB [Candidatus Paceibacterota bacterium]